MKNSNNPNDDYVNRIRGLLANTNYFQNLTPANPTYAKYYASYNKINHDVVKTCVEQLQSISQQISPPDQIKDTSARSATSPKYR